MNLYFSNYYHSSHFFNWQGRSDLPQSSAFFQIVQPIHVNDLQEADDQNLTFSLIGFKCDEGVKRNFGRVGAFEGPDAFRHALAKFPIHRKNIHFFDVGDVICEDGNLESAQQTLESIVEKLILFRHIPIVIGGGHEVAWGSYQGIRAAIKNKNVGIINFDAHFDMRPLLEEAKGSSGTPFLQIAQDCERNHYKFDYNCIGIQKTGNIPLLFEAAKKHDVNYILSDDLHQNKVADFSFVDRVLNENDFIYTTICLDVFSSGFAPGVSAIQPFGLSPWQIIPYLRKIAHSGKAILYDVAELCPKYDAQNCTAKLAASLVYEIIHTEHDKDCDQNDNITQPDARCSKQPC